MWEFLKIEARREGFGLLGDYGVTSFGIYSMSFAKTPTYRAHAEALPDKLSDLLGP